MKLVYIEWVDAHAQSGWLTEKETEDFIKNDFFIHEVGFVIKEDKKGITLAAFIRPKDNWFSRQNGDVHFIPKTWIKKRKYIKI